MSEPPVKRTKQSEQPLNEGELPEDIKKINDIQGEIVTITEEESEEVLKVQLEFNRKKRPLFEKRQAAIENIEGFWGKVLSQHPVTGQLISEEDDEALNAISSVDVTYESHRTFRVTLTFKDNPYFSNRELWKDFNMGKEEAVVTSCTIDWKDTEEAKAMKNRLVKVLMEKDEQENDPTFFSVFDEDERDFELGEAFRNDIFESPLEFFLGLSEDGEDILEFADDDEGEEEEDKDEES